VSGPLSFAGSLLSVNGNACHLANIPNNQFAWTQLMFSCTVGLKIIILLFYLISRT
jgi:hypothetical protein